ncbi:MAG: glutamate-5-semialdehyde dehydrogenase [bacterium]|nr:glutamate-5-semialdehyde dehydrogenase [bacterium]
MLSATTEKCRKARQVSNKLSNLDRETKDGLLGKIAEAISANKAAISEANAKDVTAAQALLEQGEISAALFSRLQLPEHKIDQLVTYLLEVAKLEDPIGQTQYAMMLDDGLELTRVSCPIGVLAVLFEARPEVVIQVSALSLKSGNAVILKGGSEAAHSNRVLFDLIHQVYAEAGLAGGVALIETRQDVAEILTEEDSIDLIIPRGSNAFVRFIQEHSRIPVLGHSEGICHLYIDADCDPKMAASIAVDSKTDYPSACNAVENLLFDVDCHDSLIHEVLSALAEAGVALRADAATRDRISDLPMEAAVDEDFRTEYSDLILSVKMVANLDEAIDFINQYGSHHTDSIVTRDLHKAESFFSRVDSACVFHNASTRFSDGYVFGLGAEVGISTNKTHARGPVGLEGLVIYKYLLKGKGQLKAVYSGENAKPFIHLPLPY